MNPIPTCEEFEKILHEHEWDERIALIREDRARTIKACLDIAWGEGCPEGVNDLEPPKSYSEILSTLEERLLE